MQVFVVESCEVVHTLNVSAPAADPFRVIPGGVKVQEDCAGRPEQENRTTWLNPFNGVTVIE